MKGKPVTEGGHGNAVVWANGFRSNMPDWPTARRCAISSEMLYSLKRARSMLLEMDRETQVDPAVLKCVYDSIEKADGLTAIREALEPSQPGERLKHHVTGAIERGEKTAIEAVLPPIPKPPGFK